MQIVNLQIAPTSVKPVVHVSQSDVGRQFQLRLFDGAVAYSLPSGTTARIDGIKPDKEGFSYSDATSVSGNTITVTTKTQMTITPGNVECEIRLVNNSQDIGTLNFIMLVEESPLSDVDISKTDLPDLIAEVRAAADTAVASATSASNSAESASGSATSATTAATSASTNGLKAEGYAVGKQNGADVPSGSQYYHNNAAYYANIASSLSSNPPYIGANGNWYVWNTSTSQYVDSGIDASITVAIADITMLAPNATPYVTNTGTDTDPIFHLFIPRGSGITSVTKTGTSGLVDTYTITYSDGSTTTFTVTNGKSAYDAAVDGGYDGTEAEFNADLAQFKTLAQSASTSASNASSSALSASNSATSASNKALDSEAWANGQRNGVDVPSTDPAYQNNAKYYKDQISGALNDVVGATASTNGVHGLAPAPLAGEQNKVLFGSGAWGNMDYSNLQNKPTLGTAAAKNSTNAVTQGSTDLVESGAVSAEIQTLTNQKLNTKVIDLADMAEYNNDLAMLPDGVFFVRSTVFASNTIANRPFTDGGAMVISKRLPTNNAKIMTVEPFVRSNPTYTGIGFPELNEWTWEGHAKSSNPNLLDNPWFTVNQRGQSTYSGAVYGVDRWQSFEANNVQTVNSDGVLVTKQIAQIIDAELVSKILDRNVTISMLYNNGKILKATGKIHSDASSTVDIGAQETGVVNIIIYDYVFGDNQHSYSFQINVLGNDAVQVKAVKLELGEVSTLASDTVPNYATELLKCQRYYITSGTAGTSAYGFTASTTKGYIYIPTAVKMRATPTAESLSGHIYFNGDDLTISSYQVVGAKVNSVQLEINVASGLQASNTLVVSNLLFALSADL